MRQFFGQEIVKKFVRVSSTIATLLGGSTIRLGGVNANLNLDLSLDTTVVGVGGMEVVAIAYEKYYVYLVLSGVTEHLIATTSASNPTGFISYRKVGAFYTGSTGQITKALSFGDAARNISFLACCAIDYLVSTNVNHYILWDLIKEDDADIFNGSYGCIIPEDGYYSLGGQGTPYSLNNEVHQTKVRTDTLGNVSVNYMYLPTTNQPFPQPCPVVDRYLYKGDNANMNVDSNADSSYYMRGNEKTWLSVTKKAAPEDIDWSL